MLKIYLVNRVIILESVLNEIKMKEVKKIKVILIGMVLIVTSVFSSGCNNIKYNAKLYSNVGEWIDKSFLNENKVKAYYSNENYVEGVSYPDEQYIYENDAAEKRFFIFESDFEFKKFLLIVKKKLILVRK